MRPSVKSRALQALRNTPSADCRVEEETGKLHRGKGQLEWYPVHPGTVKGDIGPIPVHDDMDGHLRNPQNLAVADINYLTGEIELEPGFRIFMCADFKVSYYFDPEKKTPVHITLRMVTMPIVATARRLPARWVDELNQTVQLEGNWRAIHRFAKTKLNKKYYKKVVIRAGRGAKPAARNLRASSTQRRKRAKRTIPLPGD